MRVRTDGWAWQRVAGGVALLMFVVGAALAEERLTAQQLREYTRFAGEAQRLYEALTERFAEASRVADVVLSAEGDADALDEADRRVGEAAARAERFERHHGEALRGLSAPAGLPDGYARIAHELIEAITGLHQRMWAQHEDLGRLARAVRRADAEAATRIEARTLRRTTAGLAVENALAHSALTSLNPSHPQHALTLCLVALNNATMAVVNAAASAIEGEWVVLDRVSADIDGYVEDARSEVRRMRRANAVLFGRLREGGVPQQISEVVDLIEHNYERSAAVERGLIAAFEAFSDALRIYEAREDDAVFFAALEEFDAELEHAVRQRFSLSQERVAAAGRLAELY